MKKREVTAQAPGRINIIGEHTDYNQGYVLPAAIDKRTIVRLKRNNHPTSCKITAKNLDASFVLDLNELKPSTRGWQNYVIGVIAELQKLGEKISGFDGVIGGDVPIGSGMSSSASLECSLAYALNELFKLNLTNLQLVHAAQMAEHNYVGIKCGIMDQFASVMGKENKVILLDCRSLEYSYYPLELGDYQIVLMNSNVSHELASSEYNTRRMECEKGVEIIREKYTSVQSLRDVTHDMLNDVSGQISNTVFRRCRHVISENLRVLETVKALNNQDLTTVGRLIYESHESLRNDYEVSCQELDFLKDWTCDKEYVLGSRMMGGGFGGCTLNIVKKDAVEQFVLELSSAYREQFDLKLTSYQITLQDGAGLMEPS